MNAARAGAISASLRLDDVTFRGQVALLFERSLPLTSEWCDDLPMGGSFRLLTLPEDSASWEESATARVYRRQRRFVEPVFPAPLTESTSWAPIHSQRLFDTVGMTGFEPATP